MKKSLALSAIMAISFSAFAEKTQTVNKKQTCHFETGISYGEESELSIFKGKDISIISEKTDENGVKHITISRKHYNLDEDGSYSLSSTTNSVVERREVKSSDEKVTRRFNKVKSTRVLTEGEYANGTRVQTRDYDSVSDILTDDQGNQKTISLWIDNRPIQIDDTQVTINMDLTPTKKLMVAQSLNVPMTPYYNEDMTLDLEEESQRTSYSKYACETEIIK